MSVRNDVSIDWAASPRIATVATPSTSISIQDIVDTFRTFESDLGALDDLSLMDASGKDFIGIEDGITKKVGITLRLLNTRVAFAARSGPGYTQCIISGGNLTAVDADGNPMNPVEPTAFTQVVYEKSSSPTMVYASGGSPTEIADAVWDKDVAGHNLAGSFGKLVQDTQSIESGRWKISGTQMIFYKEDNITEIMRFNLYDQSGNLTSDISKVYERKRV